MSENEPQQQPSSETPTPVSVPTPIADPVESELTTPPSTDTQTEMAESVEPVSGSVKNIPEESSVVSPAPEPAIEDVQNTHADAVKEIQTPAPESVSKQPTTASTSSTQNIFRGKEGRVRALEKKNAKREMQLQKILEHARAHASITNNAVEKLLHVSNATASRYLKLLVDRGMLARTGKGRSVAYAPKQ